MTRHGRVRTAVFIQNYIDAGPGHLVEILAARGIELVVCHAYVKDGKPGERVDITQFDMVFFGGAPLDPNAQDDDTLWQIDQIRLGLELNIPMFGICRGLQLLVLAKYGRVVSLEAAYQEWGMYTPAGSPSLVHLTEAATQDWLLRGVEERWFRVFQMHEMACDLTNIPDAVLLGWGDYCYVQVVRIGTMYAIQSHIEFDFAMMEHFIAEVEPFQNLGPNLMEDFAAFYDEYRALAELIINNFVDFAESVWNEVHA